MEKLEQSVRAVKHVLYRDNVKTVTQEVLDKIAFLSNSHAQEGVGTAQERFFGRAPKTYLPNSVKRFVEHKTLIRKRKEKQEKLALKKGRSSSDDFKVGDPVLIQCNISKRWSRKGQVTEARTAEDGSAQSFLVTTEDCRVVTWNKKFLKHQPGKLLRFADSTESASA